MRTPSALLLATLALFLTACDRGAAAREVGGQVVLAAPADDPVEFGPVPDFRLTSQTGEEVGLADLRGRPFVLAAIFTTCTGPCPRISTNMRALQAELRGTDAMLVSITVDPGHDTPEVLAEYAAGYGADPERWLFLTGSEEAVHALVREGFLLAVERASDDTDGQQVTHATRVVVVDREGRRRGWYDGTSESGRRQAAARVRFLAGEGR